MAARSSAKLAREAASINIPRDSESEAGSEVSIDSSSIDGKAPLLLSEVVDDENKDFNSLHSIDRTEAMFPLDFFHWWGTSPIAGQESQVILPRPNPDDIPLMIGVCCANCNECCTKSSRFMTDNCDCSRPPSFAFQPLSKAFRDERHILEDKRKRKWTAIAADSESDVELGLLSRNDQEDEFDDLPGEVEDGVYQEQLAAYLLMILNGEYVNTKIAGLTDSTILLSRATQCIMRDILSLQKRKALSTTDTIEQERIDTMIRSLFGMLEKDGEHLIMRVGPDPIDNSASFPVLNLPNSLRHHNHNLIDRKYESSHLQHQLESSNGGAGSSGSLLKIFMMHLTLSDHPLMNHEERLFARLKELFAQYAAVFQQRSLEHLADRVFQLGDELRSLTSVTRELSEEEIVQLQSCVRELTQLLPLLTDYSQRIHSLSKALYQGWRDMQEIRRQQSYTSTPALLRARRLESTYSAAPSIVLAGNSNGVGGGWKRLQNMLTKLPTAFTAATHTLKRLYNRYTNQPQQDGGSTSSNSRAPQAPPNFSLVAPGSDVAEGIKKLAQQLAASHGLFPEAILQLSDTGIMTSEGLIPAAEHERRRILSSLRFRLQVRINGHIAFSTVEVALKHPPTSFIFDLRRYYEVQLLHLPKTISVEVISRSTDRHWCLPNNSQQLAVINLPVPRALRTHSSHHDRQFTHTFAPVYGGFAFVSEPSMNASGGNMETINQPNAVVSYFNDLMPDRLRIPNRPLVHHTSRSSAGSLYIALDFSPARDEAAITSDGVMPEDLATLSSPSEFGHFGTSGANVVDFSRESDFQQLLPRLQEVDVNDPRNENLMSIKSRRPIAGLQDVFRLTGYHSAIEFYSFPTAKDPQRYSLLNYAKLKPSRRLKLLALRVQKPYLISGAIPLSEQLIQGNEVFKELLLQEELAAGVTPNELEDDDITDKGRTGRESVNLAKANNFLVKVRASFTALARRVQKKHLTTASVVIETDYFPDVQPLDVLEELFHIRRRVLKPRAKERVPETMDIDYCEMLVQVVGARNIPLRGSNGSDNNSTVQGGLRTSASLTAQLMQDVSRGNAPASPPGSPARNNPNAAIGEVRRLVDERKIQLRKRIRSFVEVKFQEHTLATIVLEGATPLWRQSLALPFLPPQNDFAPLSLEQVRDDVSFTIFDEVEEDDAERGGFLEGEDTTRREKYYLGSFRIPFTTVYKEGRIEGLFRVDTPLLNIGYERGSMLQELEKELARRPVTGNNSSASQEERQGLLQVQAGQDEPPPPVVPVSTFASTFASIFTCCILICGDCCPFLAPWLHAFMDYLTKVFEPLTRSRGINEALQLGSHAFPIETRQEFAACLSDEHTTYIKALLTLHPLLPVADESGDDNVSGGGQICSEDRMYAAYSQHWLDQLRSDSPAIAKRAFQVFATNSSGSQVMLCRFLHPQAPPEGFNTRRSCIHLVSKLPFLRDAQSFVGSIDLWCTTREFWEIGAGDEEEHAVLLYNYLRFLDNDRSTPAGERSNLVCYPSEESIKNEGLFLVIGRAIPEGPTVYILQRDRNRPTAGRPTADHYLLINPCSGHVYSAVDNNCPLQEIYMLVTPYNLWANIQTACKPRDISYDVLDNYSWRPFFGQRCPHPAGGLISFQAPMNYIPTSTVYTLQIEEAVFTAVRNSFRRWRSKRLR